MKIRILFILCFALQFASSQNALTDYFLVSNERIEITIAKDEGKYVLTLTKGGDAPKTINLGNNVGDFFEFKKQFIQKVYTELLNLPTPVTPSSANAYERVSDKAESLYFSFANNLRVLDNLDDKPKSGELGVNKRVPVYMDTSHMKELRAIYKEESSKKIFDKLVFETIGEISAATKLKEIPEFAIKTFPKVKSVVDDPRKSKTEADRITEIQDIVKNIDVNSQSYKDLQSAYIEDYFKEQYNPNNSDIVAFTYFKVQDVSFEFSKGFLEVIKVTGTFKCTDKDKYNCKLLPSFLKYNSTLLFTNKFGIGFSSRDNYKKFDNISLFLNASDKKYDVKDFDNINVDHKVYNSILKGNMFLKMDDLINYNFEVNRLTRDFSPKDQKVVVEGGEKVTLTKEETRKILEVEVFSDFEGFDTDAPNGLIQTELTKHFNVNTVRGDLDIPGFRGIGGLQYIEISGAITKVEEKERRFQPERVDTQLQDFNGNPVLSSQRFATPIDLISYRNWNIGTDINVLFFDNPDWKYQLHINGGLRFNRTAIQDSISSLNSSDVTAEEYSISFWNFYGEAKLHLLPEERYGFYAMWRPNYIHLASDRLDFKGPADVVTGHRRHLSNWVNEFEFKGYVDVGSNGQLFLRWRLFHEMGYSANNFNQIQLGFSFYLLGRNKMTSNNN